MISKGTQYLTAAGFGNIRVTAASMGKAWMIKPWLSSAAQQAILVAFGADGAAVIRATNAYLNGIAATDRSKAQALAGFINEDPMMVCSLGLSVEGVTMPIRFLVSNNAEYINTGIYNANGFHVKVKAYCISTRNAFSPIACMSNVPSNTQRNYFGLDSSQRLWAGWGQYEWNQGSSNTNQVYDFEFNSLQGSSDKYLYVDGVQQFGPGSSSYQSDSSITNVMLFARVTSGSVARHFYGGIGTAYFYDNNGNEIEVLAPFIDKVKGNVYIDLISGNIKQNANSQGAFSIGYMKKLNGQWVTWTPQTP